MLMTDIYQYIELKGRVSLLDLSRHFHIKESALIQMLDFWVKKGKLTVTNLTTSVCVGNKTCADCHSCSESALLFYMRNH